MYFKNRAEAGRKLATKLHKKYAAEHCVVLALSPGAIIIGAQISMKIHANLALLLTENIYLPGETEAIAGQSSAGTFTYNNMFSTGQLEELVSEYHGFLDEQRMQKNHYMNVVLGHGGEIKKELLRHRVVILVADGLANGFSLEVAAEFLKTVAIKRLVIATPTASVTAIDKMHLIGDELVCLSVPANYFGVDHYYEENTIPDIEGVQTIIRNITMSWSLK
jgi:predicted phosphoribosyltransferase